MGVSAHNASSSTTFLSERLVNKIQAGDQNAEAEFIKAYSNGLLLMLLHRTRNPDIARDCCQKTLLITLRKMRAGDIIKPESILAFLRSTAANVVTTHRRTENRYTHLGDKVFKLRSETHNAAARDINSETLKRLLKKVLGHLPVQRDREILQRFYLQEEDKHSICWDFDIKPEHFDRVLYRAKQRVRLMLEKQKDVMVTLYECLDENHTKTGVSRQQSGSTQTY